MSFTQSELEFLRSSRLGRIATSSSSGEPDVAVVGYRLLDDMRVEVGGMDNTRTRKYHNAKANPRASFVVDELASVDPWRPRGLKFTGPAALGEDARGRPTLVLSAETVWSWGLNEGAETTFGPIEKRSVA